MHKTMQHLNDEPMQLHEWTGPAKSRRAHPWQASYAVLAVLTSLLVLQGCSNQDAPEQASEQVGQQMNDRPLYDDTARPPVLPEAGGPAAEVDPTQPGEMSEPPGETLPRP